MSLFADYDFYTKEYLCWKEAVIDTASFDYYAQKATQKINQYTFGRIGDDVPKCVKLCCCELAELLYKADSKCANNGISSEKVGDVSVSYESEESQRKVLSNNIRSAIYSWLADTGLLYRGGKLC